MRARTAVTGLLGAGLVGALPAPALAGWSPPFRLTPPYATDLTPTRVAEDANGEAAAAFSVQDEDHPAVSEAFVAQRSSGGRLSQPLAVPAAQLVLDAAFDARGLELLTGTSPPEKPCCSTVGIVRLAHGRFGRARTLVGKLTGVTVGSLTPLPSGALLATVGTDRGVWVAQSRPGGGFGPTHRVTAVSAMPWTVAVAADAQGQSVVLWTATHGQQGEVAPNEIVAATGSARSAPHGSRTVFTAAAGRGIDELALAPASSAVTGGFIESWFDRRGAYHSQVVVSDLAAGSRGRVFSVTGQTPTGLVISGNARGDAVAAWKSCARSGSCTVRAAVRRAGRQFGPAQGLGPIDPGQEPTADVALSGAALVGWIASGHVLAAARAPGARGLGPVRTVSSTSFASNLALTYGASRGALAAWTQGTLAPDVVGAAFGP